MQVVGLSVHLVERAAKISADIRKHLAKELPNTCSDGAPPIFCHEDQMIVQAVNDTSSSAQTSFPHG
jgi:hypothetical protein